MWRRLYKKFIAPRQGDEDTRNREYVLNFLLAGTIALMSAALCLLLISFAALHNSFVLARIGSVVVMLAAVLGMYYLSRTQRFRLAAYSLVSLYFLIAISVGMSWGVTMPVAVLLFGLVVVLAGILLGPRHSLSAAGIVVLAIIGIKIAELNGLIKSDWSWTAQPSNSGTLTGFILIFGIIAVVSWLFNYRMEQSLRRSQRAEAALKRQKSLLESTVEKRTRQLQAAQLEKVQELYRFAELGQISTALMHDLANHLTTLTLDIEGLEAQNRSRVLQRAKRSMRYIDEMVLRVRDQLRGKSQPHVFNVATETEAVLAIMQHKALQAQVTLAWDPGDSRKGMRARGESVRYRQLVANLISNAIDAYDSDASGDRRVNVSANIVSGKVRVVVEDWGRGIKPEDRAKLFEPFYSTKKTGMGLGLFIAKQIAEEQFGGTVSLGESTDHTAFAVTLKVHA